jgi:hypothetical protein
MHTRKDGNYMDQPTNQQLLDAFNAHIKDDERRFTTLEKAIASRPDDERIRAIFNETLSGFFATKGSTAKSIIIGTAVILGALAVIGGSLKTLLGWIGFSYIIR